MYLLNGLYNKNNKIHPVKRRSYRDGYNILLAAPIELFVERTFLLKIFFFSAIDFCHMTR